MDVLISTKYLLNPATHSIPLPFHVHLLCDRHSAKSSTGIMPFHFNKVRLFAIDKENPVPNRFNHLPKFTQLCGGKALSDVKIQWSVQLSNPCHKASVHSKFIGPALSYWIGTLLLYVLLGLCKHRGCDV